MPDKKRNPIFNKTRICKHVLHGKKCMYNKYCTFAHTESELKYVECKFENCKLGKKCLFKHRGESRKEYRIRRNFLFPNELEKQSESSKMVRKLKRKKYTKKQKTNSLTLNSFVINPFLLNSSVNSGIDPVQNLYNRIVSTKRSPYINKNFF